MANEKTGKAAGAAAARVLAGKGKVGDAESAAGSALTQRPNKPKAKPKPKKKRD